MSDFTIAAHSDFFTAFRNLPLGIQKKTGEFMKKFEKNPQNPGQNLEKLNVPYDDKFYSARIDLAYRVIIAVQEQTNTYILLWVDHHDEAYDWVKSKKIEVNKLTGIIQLYECSVVKVKEEVVISRLFDKYTDSQLFELGLPELQLAFVRSIKAKEDFYNYKSHFSTDVFEYLSFLVEGSDYTEVLALANALKGDTLPSDDFNQALKSGRSKRSFAVIEGQDELEKMLELPLDKWRVFLHPSQQKLVDRDFSGPARVSGEAGTGKTVVAMHRAKYLLGQNRRVLFTTFTTNLVGDIETNIMKILSLQEAKRLDIKSIDSIIISYLNSKGKTASIVYNGDELLDYWKKAIDAANIDLDMDAPFYMEEWRKIATVMDNLSVEKYISVPRLGRGVRLDRIQRLKVWHVFEEYISLLEKDRKLDIDYATYNARQLLKSNPEVPYDSIIVDEGQDISANAYKFLRLFAGEEHTNDIFVVGDNHQRIYKNKAILSKCGINIKGRSNLLRINYRTTEETRKYAYSFLNGINFDDVDTEYEKLNQCQSLTHGDIPVIQNFETYEEQLGYVSNEIKRLVDNGIRYEEICIVSRTHKQIDKATSELNKAEIPCYEINSNREDNSSQPGVRIATMHRVKGLEFRYVFVISVNKNIIPMTSYNYDKMDNDENDTIERCLLYVSLTRAQIKAFVLSYGEPSILIKNQ